MSKDPLGRPLVGLLRNLTLLQHLLFAALFAIGVGQAWRNGTPRVSLAVVSLALATWYAVGARRSIHRDRLGADLAASHPSRSAVLWLLVLAVLWGGAVAVSPAFVWLGFGLWLLAAHLLPLPGASLFSVVVLAVVIAAPVVAGGSWSAAAVVGPTVGALFALALSRGQVLLARDSLERVRLVESLVRAQDESAALHEQLAAAQREAGALAERTRLSREIHDTLAQGFSSIVLLARGASVTNGEPQLRHLLDRIEQTAVENLGEARHVVADLAPKTLQDNGLAVSLGRLLDDLAADTGIATELRVDTDFPAIGTTAEVVLLRTAQSALANVRSHARASRLVVSLSDATDEVRLDVVDDGMGFDAAALRTPGTDLSRGGYGLISTRARLHEIGGGLDIESTPGDGTAISAHLPVHRARSDGSGDFA